MGNTERFTGRVEVYERYRQRYSGEQIIALLEQWCGLRPDWTVADIGAGTGMLTEVFLANGNPVTAVEPNSEMLSTCAQLSGTWPLLALVEATAESTTIPAASIDIVTAGRAFHWFDVPRAITEFRRILKPRGWLALVSLGRSKDDSPQSVAFEALLTDHGTDYKYVRNGYRVHENLRDIYTGELHQTQIGGEQKLDWPSYYGQAMSFSIVPGPDDPTAANFNLHLREHFERFAVDGYITVPTTCWISAGRLGPEQLSTR
jgi:ubiquinone/menaquinone biosynthesis C-methylase UbiE